MSYLDKSGLTYFFSKLKTLFASQLTVSGRTVTLKSKSGATLSTITTQDTTYSAATTSANGLMTSSDKTKLNGIYAGATALKGVTATLPSSGWTSSNGVYTYTVTVSGVTASNVVFVQPAPASADLYGECGISCTGQAANALTFTAKKVPSGSLSVYVTVNSV